VAALEFQGVTVRYEHAAAPVIRSLSLTIEPGERVALLGLNGSGKTTLLLATVGLVPFEGTIFVGGTRVEQKSLRAVRAKVGFVFSIPEDQLLFPNGLEDVAFGAIRSGMSRLEARHRALQVMTELGVAHLADAPLHHLSHGQKQRIALAGALVTSPPVLLLDEPSAGLDPRAKRQLAEYLVTTAAAAIVATHDIEFASKVCQRYLLLEDGQTLRHGSDFEGVASTLSD